MKNTADRKKRKKIVLFKLIGFMAVFSACHYAILCLLRDPAGTPVIEMAAVGCLRLVQVFSFILLVAEVFGRMGSLPDIKEKHRAHP